MRTISLLMGLVLLCAAGHSQNPGWALPGQYLEYFSNNSFYFQGLPSPATLCNAGVSPNQNGNVVDGYDGQIPDCAANMGMNRDGEVEFFIVEGVFYDGEGNYIDQMLFGQAESPSSSEVLVVPDPANCDRYYIISARVTHGFPYEKTPYVYLLDMSLPNQAACPDCAHYGQLVDWYGSHGYQGVALPISFLEDDYAGGIYGPGKIANCHLAASDLQAGNFHWVFISDPRGIHRFKIGNSGIVSDDYFIPFGNFAENQFGIRSEMELVELPIGGFRLATPYSPNSLFDPNNAWEYLFVVDLDPNADPVPGTEIRFPFYRYTPGGLDQSATIKGVEFSDNGDRIYVTHTTNVLQPDQMEYYDFGTMPQELQAFGISSSIDVQYSMLELTTNDRLVMANQNGLYLLPNATNGNPALVSQMNSFSYAPTWEGITNDYSFKLYQLPDQIDGMDYTAQFTSTVECCVNSSEFQTDSYSAASGNWQPNTTFNGTQNPLQPAVTPDIFIKKELRIPAGVDLTIENMQLYFAPDARLVIENGTNGQQGGKLTLKNTLLAVDQRCSEDETWLGVEVWGNANEAQGSLNSSSQGRLFLDPGSRIEHAQIGVLLGRRNHTETNEWNCPPIITVQPFSFDYARTGGIVRGNKASFFGNQRGVYFLPYLASSGSNNLGRFVETDFSWDGPLHDGLLPQQHAYLRQVKGINFLGCSFQNVDPSLFSYTQLGTGIFGYAAQFYVKPLCPVLTLPCEPCADELRSSFENLRFGIRTFDPAPISGTSSMTFTTLRSDFENCQYGIHVHGTDGEKLKWNRFEVRQANYQTAGIALYSSKGFRVEENDISGLGSPSGSLSYGIVVNGSGTDQNEVYHNTLSDLHIGSQSEGINATEITTGNEPGTSGFEMSGLNWTCNQFLTEIERTDIAVVNGRIDFFQGHAIGHNSVAEAVEGSARNHFSLHGEPQVDAHDVLVSGNPVQELQYVGLNTVNYWADSYTASEVLPLFSLYNGVPVSASPGMCPAKCGKTKAELMAARQQLLSDIADLEDQLQGRYTAELDSRLRQLKETLDLLESRLVTEALVNYESLSDLQADLNDLDAGNVYADVAAAYAAVMGGDEPRLDEPAEFFPIEEETSEKRVVEVENGGFKLFPNPTSESFQIDWSGLGEGPMEVVVLDVTGRRVHGKTLQGGHSTQIDVSQLPASIYQVVLLRNGRSIGTQKVQVMR